MNHHLEYLVIIGYFVFLLGIGFAFRKFNADVSDYFRSGCRGTWWLVGSSTFMAGISAYTFTGAAGVAYQAGWSVMIIYVGSAMGFLINYFWFAARFRQMRKITGPDVIRERFDKFTEQYYSWITIPLGIVGTGLGMYSLAIFSSAVFGLKVEQVIVAVGLVMLFYSVTGGSWAVMATDFIQCLIMLAMTLLVTGLCLYQLGGFGGLFEQIAAKGLSEEYRIVNDPGQFNRSFTWAWVIAMLIRRLLINNTLETAPRYFSVKDGKEAKKAALLGAALLLFGAGIWFVPPMAARILFPEAVEAVAISKPAEAAFAITCVKMLPPGMIGLMVVAMFAASMSSMDTGLNRNAAVFIRNVYPPLQKLFRIRDISEAKMLFMSQIFSALFGLCSIVCALAFAAMNGLGQFELMLMIGALLGVPMAVPLFWGILIRRTPPWAAVCSMTLGFAGSLAAYFSLPLFGFKMVFQDQVFLTMSAATFGFFMTMPFAKYNTAAQAEKVRAFFETMNTPVDFEKEVGHGNDLSQLKIIGWFTLSIAAFIALLAIPAQNALGVVCPLLVSIFIGAVGAIMLAIGHKASSTNLQRK